MTFLVNYPESWIGVPDRWPFPGPVGTEFSDAEHWLSAIVDEVDQSEDAPLAPEVREHVREVLAMAEQRSASAGSRVYVTFEAWNGSAFVVEAAVESRDALGSQSIDAYAGAGDPSQLGPVFAEEFTSEHGVPGVYCVRYLPFDEHGVVYGRLDYVFAADDLVLRISGGELDLVDFERLKVLVRELAATVEVASRDEAIADPAVSALRGPTTETSTA